jgi:hypothetical protein
MAASLGVAALSIGLNQLAAHSARLQGATSENEAVDAAIPAYDADIAAIASAYNGGSAPASECNQALNMVAQNCYSYFKGLVGKPGTSWIDTGSNPNQPTKTCNKSCTVSCCVFYDDILPGIFNMLAAISTAEGSPSPQNSGVVSSTATIPKVYPGKYSSYTRALYTVPLKKPAKANYSQRALQVSGLVVKSVPVAKAAPAPAASRAPAPATTVAAGTVNAGSIGAWLGTFDNSQIVLAIVALGGILFTVSLLFGADAVRVNK